jgi:hypothetical protein
VVDVSGLDEYLTSTEREVDGLFVEMSRTADAIHWSLDRDQLTSQSGRRRRLLRRRGVAVVLVVATVVALIVVPLAHLHVAHGTTGPSTGHGPKKPRPAHQRTTGVIVPIAPGQGVQAMALYGSILYVATDYSGDPPYALSAYDTSTGRLIHQVTVPAMPATLRVGPGGGVWLTFYPDQNGGPTATWLLSPNLTQRSSTSRTAPTAIVPVSPNSAQVVSQYGLALLRMPSPGQAAHVTLRPEAHTSIGKPLDTAPGYTAFLLDGHVVVAVTNGYGYDSHLVVAGRPGVTFGDATQQVAWAVGVGSTVWAATFPSGAQTGSLVQLNDRLQPITPRSIRSDAIFDRTEQVWVSGDTVWVATAAAGHRLVCFVDSGRLGPVATVPVGGEPAAVVASSETLYVTDASSTADATSNVVAYEVPAACR